MSSLPDLVSKALVDNGYDLLHPTDDGWFIASTSGLPAQVAVKTSGASTLLAVPESGVMARIGLSQISVRLPLGMANGGVIESPAQLYESLRILHALQTHLGPGLSSEVEKRLAAIPATERTKEVRQRIGQEVYRDALMELWQGRCALSGVELPSSLLRASHAKPWKDANDGERLDPFNGLLLAVHYDALFDKGLITFSPEGKLIISPMLNDVARKTLNLDPCISLQHMLPGHESYLDYHRNHVAAKNISAILA